MRYWRLSMEVSRESASSRERRLSVAVANDEPISETELRAVARIPESTGELNIRDKLDKSFSIDDNCRSALATKALPVLPMSVSPMSRELEGREASSYLWIYAPGDQSKVF